MEIFLAFAVWRVASLLVNEDGPFGIFLKFRYFIGVRYDEYSVMYAKNQLAELFVCVRCMSIWISLAMAWMSPFATNVIGYAVVALSLSTMSIIIDSIINRLND